MTKATCLLFSVVLLACAKNAGAAKPKFLVVLDPGHGGEDTGAIASIDGRRIYEKDITMAIARRTQRHLRAHGVPAVLTRSDDRWISLDQRTESANRAALRAQNAAFISIHVNSADEPSSHGAETYVLNVTSNEASRRLADLENGISHADPGRRPALLKTSHSALDLILSDLASTANYAESVDLACAVQRSTIHAFERTGSPVRDRGLRQALFYVLMQTRMPGVLYEPGFLTNPQDLARLTAPEHQERLARNLAEGILRWRKANKRSPQRLSAVSKSKARPCAIIKD